MRKVFALENVTLDGFFAGPNGEIDWFVHDPEVDKATHEMMHPGTLLPGRVTYQMFESYWPNVILETFCFTIDMTQSSWAIWQKIIK